MELVRCKRGWNFIYYILPVTNEVKWIKVEGMRGRKGGGEEKYKVSKGELRKEGKGNSSR